MIPVCFLGFWGGATRSGIHCAFSKDCIKDLYRVMNIRVMTPIFKFGMVLIKLKGDLTLRLVSAKWRVNVSQLSTASHRYFQLL